MRSKILVRRFVPSCLISPSDVIHPTRLPSGEVQLQVVVDGQRRGGIDFLRSIRVAQVRQVRYLSAADATTRLGTGMAGGAILVSLRSR